MKHFLLIFISILFLFFPAQAVEYQPKASPEAVVIAGNARFTILTSRLIRMEWSEDGQFEDRATLGVVNRLLDVPEYKVRHRGNVLTITTSDLVLSYSGNARFDRTNLKVAFDMPNNSCRGGVRNVVWTPGSDDSGNLLGTARTLDGCDGTKMNEPYDKGVISCDGWAVIDESDRHLFVEDDSDWETWVEPRDSMQRLDLYLFAYGHDYKSALGDFVRVAGRIPLPPKYVFGYWWSRYWQYSDAEFTDLGRQIRSMGIPIDVMVIDMDWHHTWSLRSKDTPKDVFGERIGWTGYTWHEKLFPNPSNFLADIHNLKMKTSLNLHPASGIQPQESCYDEFVKDYLSRTSEYDGPHGYIYPEGGYRYAGCGSPVGNEGEKAPVPFRIDDRHWADAYFNSVIAPLEDMGVDFWWLDWQQWKESRYMKGLSNTFWINRTFFDDKVRRTSKMGKNAPRPLIYHRWGGLGSHRYQIGFSGDTYCTWDVLGYLPYFTATASNVGYGYWGHDIGGHMLYPGQKGTDAQMLTRWLQYGVFTPIFKTHSTKDLSIERRFWRFPDFFDAMRDAVRLRYTLSPYIYNAARTAYDTGVSICRPMYYDYPEDPQAYLSGRQYMFGDDILVSSISEPADSVTGLSELKWWLPAGDDWYDVVRGTLVEGGVNITGKYTIDEIPYFIKAGSVIPMASSEITNLQDNDNTLYLLVVPGGGDFVLEYYEDDGVSQAYETDFATTLVTKKSGDGKVVLNIAPRKGAYEGMPQTRKLRVVFDNILPPSKILVNGKIAGYSRFPEEGTWGYDGRTLAATLILAESSCDEALTVECFFSPEESRTLLDGKKSLIRRMYALAPEAKLVFGRDVDPYLMLPEEFFKVSQCASMITENPDKAAEYLRDINPDAVSEAFMQYEELSQEFKEKVNALIK